MRTTLVVAFVASLSLTGCGDDGGSDGDANADARSDGTVPPTDLPDLRPCPAGWQEVGGGAEPVVCEPWPAGGEDACDASSAHFPGEPGCALIGSTCPAGDFEEGLADDGSVIFVLAGASGGDGTRGAPFGSATDALATAPPGTVVALSKGVHDGPLTVPDGVTLRGACVAETRLRDPAAGEDIVVTLSGIANALENVTVEAGDGTGVYGEYLGEATISDVVVEGSGASGSGVGIEHGGVSLVVNDVRISDVDVGLLYVIEGGARAFEVERIVIEDVASAVVGFGLEREATFALRDASIRDTTLSTVELDTDNGIVEIERTIIENGSYTGILLQFSGTNSISDVVIRDMQSDGDGVDGAGLAFSVVSSVFAEPIVVRRVLVDRVRDAGLYAFDSTVDAEGLVIRGVRRQACTDCESTGGAAGIAAEDMATIDVRDFFVSEVDGCGVNVGSTGEMDLADGFVRGATVGACVRAEGFDVERLTTDVRYSDNMSSLDSTGLPVPTLDGEGSIR